MSLKNPSSCTCVIRYLLHVSKRYVRYCSVWSCSGGKKYTGPCGGRDCSGGCQCFPEKGSRVSNIFIL
uniref:Uncharacterized protein n=1 Tax=Malurus cyaneus samueli TaxID=2593467 RepID=A0A8C5X1N1_9PASS